MIKMSFDAEDTTLLVGDIKYLHLTENNFSNNQEWCYTISNLKHFLDDEYCPRPPVSQTTFNKGLRILNKKLCRKTLGDPINKNMASIPTTSPIHTQIFYNRLFTYLFNKGQSLLNYVNTGYTSNMPSPFFSDNYFGSKNEEFLISPSFTPLFVGLIGSLSKEKDWRKLKDNTLSIARGFYTDAYKETEESGIFNPNYHDGCRNLYKYWLDILFPDELFDLTLKFEQIIYQTYETMFFDLRHNLYLLSDKLPNIIFKSRIGQRRFYCYMTNKLDEFLDFPRNYQINLTNEFAYAQITIHIYEDSFYIKTEN